MPAAKAEAKAKASSSKTGIASMDALFDGIRDARATARKKLKDLRREWKKDRLTAKDCFSFFTLQTTLPDETLLTRQLACFQHPCNDVSSPRQEDARRRRLLKKKNKLSKDDVKNIAEMMGMTASSSSAGSEKKPAETED